jgi:hypothetical protein
MGRQNLCSATVVEISNPDPDLSEYGPRPSRVSVQNSYGIVYCKSYLIDSLFQSDRVQIAGSSHSLGDDITV